MAKTQSKALIEELTEKQKIFCREYVYDWNGTRAAKVAGYSEDSAAVIASENLRKPNIQAYITEIQKDLEKLAGISRLQVIGEHQKLAFSSIAKLHNTWITRKEFEELTEDQKASIAEIQTQTRIEVGGIDGKTSIQVDYVKIKLFDKQKSLDSISKMLGYDAPKKIELSGNVSTNSIKLPDGTELPI
jgi:phage terminase small subunit